VDRTKIKRDKVVVRAALLVRGKARQVSLAATIVLLDITATSKMRRISPTVALALLVSIPTLQELHQNLSVFPVSLAITPLLGRPLPARSVLRERIPIGLALQAVTLVERVLTLVRSVPIISTRASLVVPVRPRLLQAPMLARIALIVGQENTLLQDLLFARHVKQENGALHPEPALATIVRLAHSLRSLVQFRLRTALTAALANGLTLWRRIQRIPAEIVQLVTRVLILVQILVARVQSVVLVLILLLGHLNALPVFLVLFLLLLEQTLLLLALNVPLVPGVLSQEVSLKAHALLVMLELLPVILVLSPLELVSLARKVHGLEPELPAVLRVLLVLIITRLLRHRLMLVCNAMLGLLRIFQEPPALPFAFLALLDISLHLLALPRARDALQVSINRTPTLLHAITVSLVVLPVP